MQIRRNIDTSLITTFRLSSRAKYAVELNNENELYELSGLIADLQLPTLSIGGGSNIVFCTDYPGVIVKQNMRYVQFLRDNKVRVSSDYTWDDFISLMTDRGFSDYTYLSGIPGSVGGAIALNAGAYGQRVENLVHSVKVYDINARKIFFLKAKELKYRHRCSIFRINRGANLVIIDALFKTMPDTTVTHPKINILPSSTIKNAEKLREAILSLRSHLPDPVKLANCGSFFLNPIITNAKAYELLAKHPAMVARSHDRDHQQIAAGWLMEKAELKGAKIGSFYIHEKHANVVINQSPRASGLELLRFISVVNRAVYDKFGIILKPEPLLIGEEFYC